MNRLNDKRNLARSLFIKDHLSRKQIAAQVGITEKTLRNWIAAEDWEAIKEAETISRPVLLQDAYKQLKAINKKITDELDGIPNKELSDAKGVIRKEIEALSDNPLHLIVDVVNQFNSWVHCTHPKKLRELVPLTNEFIEEKAKEEGL